MGGFSPSRDSGSADAPNTSKSKVTKTRGEGGLIDFISKGGITGAVIRAAVKIGKTVKKNYKTKKTNEALLGSADYQGGKTFSSSTVNNNNGGGNGNKNQLKGIELAKASTASATILGPSEIQKEAANTIKGPTTTEMSAADILLKNKRKGRKITNITGSTGLAKEYKLSKKTLLG